MSSYTRRIQQGRLNHAGLLSSLTARRGTRLGVHNEKAKDLLARQKRETDRLLHKALG